VALPTPPSSQEALPPAYCSLSSAYLLLSFGYAGSGGAKTCSPWPRADRAARGRDTDEIGFFRHSGKGAEQRPATYPLLAQERRLPLTSTCLALKPQHPR